MKPISLEIEECKTNIINSINNSHLHPSILELILKDIYSEVVLLKNQTMEKESEKYNESEDKQDAESTSKY